MAFHPMYGLSCERARPAPGASGYNKAAERGQAFCIVVCATHVR